MARAKFLLQGIRQNNDHASAIKDHLELEDIEQILIGVAFIRESGVIQLKNFLVKHCKRITVYAGIRNGITSAQGLLALHNLKIKLFTVDTGASSSIFHPKSYIAFNQYEGRVIIGSANLTISGLYENIEASTMLIVDRQNTVDSEFLTDLISTFHSMHTSFPDHVVLVNKKSDIIRLLEEGRIEDERVVRPSVGTNRIGGEKRDQLKKMKLFRKQHQITGQRAKRKRHLPSSEGWELLWISKGLTERDLNIPSGNTTHSTGSMLLKKGKLEGIDQRSYFRQIVFSSLIWMNDLNPRRSHLERAETEFDIVIKGINLGCHVLKLTHNSLTNSLAYKQLNAMTQIHWGDVKDLVAHSDLLARELRLYQSVKDPKKYLLEID